MAEDLRPYCHSSLLCAVLLSVMAVSCNRTGTWGGDEDGDTSTSDTPVDHGADVSPDAPTDVPADVPEDSPLDAPGDVAGDGEPDASTDSTEDVAPDGPVGAGSISGVVHTPQSTTGNFPMSDALVYLTRTDPAPITDATYCLRCRDLPTGPHLTYSGTDGSFTISSVPAGSWRLVVEKGGFRRIRDIDVVADTTTPVPVGSTTFPNAHDPSSGDYTPRVAVALGSYDRVEDILAKMGICDLDTSYHAVRGTCDHVDFYNNGASYGTSYPNFQTLLADTTLLDDYHVIVVPCSSSYTDSALSNATILSNIRNWVDSGGRWIVADWSYDFVEQVFSAYLDFEGDDATIGAADSASSSWDTTGAGVDAGLRSWLNDSLGQSPDSVRFVENWDCIAGIGSVSATDPDGSPITVIPERYCEGAVTRSHGCLSPGPLSVIFPYGCGRVLYSTYHTVGEIGGGHAGLDIQEKIIVYLLFESGLCM